MTYFGSKAASGAFQNIISLMPPHDVYIETHLGGGAIMKRKPPAQRNIGIDLSPSAIEKFKCGYAVDLINTCAHKFLREYQFKGNEFVYVDPPYVLSTRTSRKRYEFDYSDEKHVDLLEIVSSLPCNLLISGYPNNIYDQYLAGWKTVTFQVMTRGGPRTEKLWFNYPLNKVHWCVYAGHDFTDRQRIKRKTERWMHNYRNLKPYERLSIMSALMKAEAELQHS